MAGSRGKWVVVVVGILLILALWIGAFAYLLTRGPSRAAGQYRESVLVEGAGGKIALINLSGVITSARADPYSSVASDQDLAQQIDQAMQDRQVVAIILELDTPGGEVVASDNIYRKLREARQEGKSVVALMQGTAASGGYYVSAAADEIVANPDTITGSIGVILSLFNVEAAAEKLGIRATVLKSGPHKDIGSPFRELPEEELAMLQDLIDETYSHFVDIVAEGRGMEVARVREIADGRIFSGRQAMQLGLVDHLGGREVALERARALADDPDAFLVRYEPRFGLSDLLSPFGGLLRDRLGDETGLDLRPGLKYLWLL